MTSAQTSEIAMRWPALPTAVDSIYAGHRPPSQKDHVWKAGSSRNLRHEGIYFARSTAIRSSVRGPSSQNSMFGPVGR